MLSAQAAPRERPILFSAPMVLAILDGRKTVTRRLSSRYQVGDLLWVREAFALSVRDPEAFERDTKNPDDWDPPVYRATYDGPGEWAHYDEEGNRSPIAPPWRPSIYMPKWASRIWLEVVSVRKERLQDITEEGAKAEGIQCSPVGLFDPIPIWHFGDFKTPSIYDSPIAAFKGLWDRVHGEGAWASNPEVHVIEFRRVK